MNHRALLCLATLIGMLPFLAGCPAQDDAGHDAAADAAGEAIERVVRLEAKSGSAATGTATFTQADGTITLQLEVQNVAPGEHAFHIHEVGDCSAPDGSSAGGHWNPTGQDHGRWGSAPHHLGDVGNVTVGEDGTGRLQLVSQQWSIGSGEADDIVGHAVILHSGADDFTTQPTGNAGGRIACGVIR